MLNDDVVYEKNACLLQTEIQALVGNKKYFNIF